MGRFVSAVVSVVVVLGLSACASPAVGVPSAVGVEGVSSSSDEWGVVLSGLQEADPVAAVCGSGFDLVLFEDMSDVEDYRLGSGDNSCRMSVQVGRVLDVDDGFVLDAAPAVTSAREGTGWTGEVLVVEAGSNRAEQLFDVLSADGVWGSFPSSPAFELEVAFHPDFAVVSAGDKAVVSDVEYGKLVALGSRVG